MNLLEEQLLASIVEWGKYQVEAEGGDSQHGPTLRAKILSALNLIKFTELPPEIFAKMCQYELGNVLSVSEKLAHFKSMSGGFSVFGQRTADLPLHFVECASRVTAREGAEHSVQFTFQINRQANILTPSFNGYRWELTRFELRDNDGNVVIEADAFEDSGYILASDVNYTLDMSFSCEFDEDEDEGSFQTFLMLQDTTATKAWLTLTAISSSMFVGASGILLSFCRAFSYPLTYKSVEKLNKVDEV
jgi:hypothetical protein